MRDSRHKASDVLAAVVDPGVAEGKKGSLYKHSHAQRHGVHVLCSDPEFHVVEKANVFEESARVGKNLPSSMSLDAVCPHTVNTVQNVITLIHTAER